MGFTLPADSLGARLLQLQQSIAAGALPSPVIEFGPWMPDRGELANPGCLEAKNVIPKKDHYAPANGLTSISGALTARCIGAMAARDAEGDVFIFAGDATKLYSLASASFSDVSKVGGYTTPADYNWEFVLWGSSVLATNYTEPVQAFNLNSSSVFADMITSTLKPKARHIAVVREFVVLGGTNDAVDGEKPNRVWWSALNDNTKYDPSESTLSDFNDFPSGGWVQRIVGGEQFGLVFFETEIRRMLFVGSPKIFRFDIIDKNRGTDIPNSVVTNGLLTCFHCEEGWFVTDGNSSVPIGDGQIDKWFSDNYDSSYSYRVSAAFDPVNKLFMWSFPSTSATGGVPDKILCWNWVDKKWSHIDLDHEWLILSFTQGYTLDGLDAIGTDIDNATLFPVSFDSRVWTGGELRIGAFNTSHQLAQFTGTTLQATIDSGVFAPNGKGLSDLTGVSPLVTGTTSITVKLASVNRLGDTLTYGSAVSINAYGKANLVASGQFFKAETIIAAGETGWKAQGIRVHASTAGDL
jgi:hypothetical protein